MAPTTSRWMVPALLTLTLLPLIMSSELNPTPKRCMLFSWIGSESGKYFNESESTTGSKLHTTSCKELPDPKPIPCISPSIIGSVLPNCTRLHKKFGKQVECVPQPGEVCAVVTFLFSNEVVNISAYCTRVTVDDKEPLQKGCATAKVGAYTNSVCVGEPQSSDVGLPNLCEKSSVPSSAFSYGNFKSCYVLLIPFSLTFLKILKQMINSL